MHAGKQIDQKMYRRTGKTHADRQIGRQENVQLDRQVNGQIDSIGETDRETDRGKHR